ncbi:hypothetical protein G5714_014677 [Onychostoma macrolepis]|uniref:Uncharacterized protein n=1 Tax=Onychostoma macrolepis TaxID=369639 RepID=A0A7J6CE28_9TELE|nr:hypothetical protein G5714_014677 [Onychostoma macrolepis]
MKNPHLSEILPSGDKRLKRKAREPMKRVSDERLPYFKLYKSAHLAAETETRDDSAFSGAVDMRINAVPDSRLREKPVSGRSAPAQGFPLERALPRAPPLRRLARARTRLGNAPGSRRSKPSSRRADCSRTRARGRACTPSAQPLRRCENRCPATHTARSSPSWLY